MFCQSVFILSFCHLVISQDLPSIIVTLCSYTVAVLHFAAIITTQPRDVTVPLGGTAVFTFLVELGENVNTDVQWDHMGNAITRLCTNPYMVINDFFDGFTQLNSTLIIT